MLIGRRAGEKDYGEMREMQNPRWRPGGGGWIGGSYYWMLYFTLILFDNKLAL